MWEIGFVNLMMLLAAIPERDNDDNDKGKGEEMSIDELVNECNK